jgi:hypothetical protein
MMSVDMQKIILFGFLFITAAWAEDASTQHPLLISSLNNHKNQVITEIAQVSNWLTELPTVNLSVLNSTQSEGSDEWELGVNLPFKTPTRKRLDKQLANLSVKVANTVKTEQALLFSGLIRESIWNHQIAAKKLEIEQFKMQWLEKQRKAANLLSESNGTRLDVLLVEHQINQTKVQLLELKKEVNTRLKQFQNITGVVQVPADFYETVPLMQVDRLQNHPGFRQLQLAVEHSEINFELAGKANTPVNLILSTVATRSPGYDDRQYGVGVAVPFGTTHRKSQQELSSWQQEQASLNQQINQFKQQFESEMIRLQSEHQFLREKQPLLEQQSIQTQQIFQQLEQLRASNEMNQGLYYQHMVNLLSNIYLAELNQLYINQNQSRQQQLAGAPL